MQKKAIAIIATLDTKGPETAFVKSLIEADGFRAVVVDTGILEHRDPDGPVPDFSADQIAAEGGADRSELIAKSAEKETRDRGIRAMSSGSAKMLRQLYDQGQICGVVGLGGAQGTEIGATAMRALPLGVPKMMVSTVASGQTPFGIYTGTRDLTIMHSVVDILGLNSLMRRILSNAVGAVVGMVRAQSIEAPGTSLKIGLTIYGQTTPAALVIKPQLESSGYEVFAFHSNGTGGQAMEELAVEGMLDGLFDLSTHEITDEIYGGIHAGDANRLLSGGLKGIPRLVVPGGLDIITLRELETIPEIYRQQPYVKHNPHITLVRLTTDQMVKVADVMVKRLNQATAPVIVAIPKGGFSFYNRDGLHFRDMKADRAFIQTLKTKLKPEIEICELDGHVNDPVFIEAILSLFERLIQPWKIKNTREVSPT
ncbi:MAG: Tm-1-like ATP-binding domain-containing protein [Desulfobacterales bacterium]|nr:Tm-1-like ATP-binding domain-containing protein [Desulfobacterales bacterium]